MNTEKLKNHVLILLLILNVAFFILNIDIDNKHILTSQQVEAIQGVLEDNQIMIDISLFEPLLDYSLKELVNMKGFTWDEDKVLEFFFTDVEKIEKNNREEGAIYLFDKKELVYQKDTWYYDDYKPKKEKGYIFDNKNSMEKFCDGKVRKLQEEIKDISFSFDRMYKSKGKWHLEYRTFYQGDIIYSNQFLFTLTDKGLTQMRLSFDKVSGKSKEKVYVQSVDEALLSALYEIKRLYPEQEIQITDIDLVLEDTKERDINNISSCEYFYRIYIDKQMKPLLINGYTGEVYY